MIYTHMADEMVKLAATKKKPGFKESIRTIPGYVKSMARDPASLLATKSQRAQLGTAIRRTVEKPSRLLKLPKVLGKETVKQTTQGFRTGGPMSKALHGFFVADPILTAASLRKKGLTAKQKGEAMGKSLGSSIAGIASTRLPFASQLLTMPIGEAIGGRIGRAVSPRSKTRS